MIRQKKATEKSTPESFAGNESSKASGTKTYALVDGDRTDSISEREYAFAKDALEIFRYWSGSNTPIEDFIVSVVRGHRRGGLSYEDLKRKLEAIRLDFDEAIIIAADMFAKYPDLVGELLPGSMRLRMQDMDRSQEDAR